MIDLKGATERAKQFITELNGEPEHFQIEEIILSDDKKTWLVTVSYYIKVDAPNNLQKTLGLSGRRIYKRIVVDSQTAEIIGMFNWSYDMREAA